MTYFSDSMIGQTLLLAQQQEYSMVIAVVILCIFLGSVMIIVPRPRKKYSTATEQRDANMRKVKRKRPAVPQPSAAVPQHTGQGGQGGQVGQGGHPRPPGQPPAR